MVFHIFIVVRTVEKREYSLVIVISRMLYENPKAVSLIYNVEIFP